MGLFICEGWLLSRIIPFHRELDRKELHGTHLLALDGLRGVLALGVFFVHAIGYYYFQKTGVWDYPPSNFYSQMAIFPVTMFFFITGYLFWSKLIRTSHIPALQFYYRRLGRLGPAYGFACLFFFFLVAIASHFHRNEPFHKIGVEALLWIAFISPSHDINAIANSKEWFGQAWTLRYEWMFYLLLPFLGWFARKRFRLVILLAAAAIFYTASTKVHLHGVAGKLEEIFGSYVFYLLFVFSVGMFVAILRPTEAWVKRARSRTAALIALALVGFVLVLVKPHYGWLESIILALPFACVCFGNNWLGLLTLKPLRFLGRISYSIYLLHLPFLIAGIFLIKKVCDITAYNAIVYWAYMTLCGALTIVASAYCYQYLEHPFLHLGRPKIKPVVQAAS